ncbi:MAG TPA: hypothetical protein VGM88_33920 [Kofleriaceae bacterium]|jgi:hypothetical protein
MRVIVFALVAAGCGFHAGATSSDGPPVIADTGSDAGSDAAIDGPADARPDAPRDAGHDAMIDAPVSCFGAWDGTNQPTFGTPMPLAAAPNLSQSVDTTFSERDPFLSDDELNIYFSRGGASNDIYVGVRASTSDPFVVETNPLTNVSSTGDDGKLSFDHANHTVLATTAGGGDVHAVGSTRTAIDAFGPTNQTHLGAVNADMTKIFDTEIAPDGLRLYFAAEPDGANQHQNIRFARRNTTSDDWTMVADVGGVNSGTGDADPTVANGDLLILFSSRRAGNGDADLYYATRAHRDDAFGTPVALGTLDTADDDGDPWLSTDGCRLYFASDRGGDWDIYEVDVQP